MGKYSFTNVGRNTDLSFEGITFVASHEADDLFDHSAFEFMGGAAFFSACSFVGFNVGSSSGAAVRLHSNAQVEFEHCYFGDNTVTNKGSAIWMDGTSLAYFSFCVFERNRAGTVRSIFASSFFLSLSGLSPLLCGGFCVNLG